MMLYPAMTKLTEHIPNRYMMVNVVARRARQIAQEAEVNGEPLEESPLPWPSMRWRRVCSMRPPLTRVSTRTIRNKPKPNAGGAHGTDR